MRALYVAVFIAGCDIHGPPQPKPLSLSAPMQIADGVYSQVAADFDNDGHLDLALSGGPTTQIWLNGATWQMSGSIAGSWARMAAADLSGDGKLDLVAVANDGASGRVGFFDGAGDGTFTASTNEVLVAPLALTTGDVTSSGRVAAIVSSAPPAGAVAVWSLPEGGGGVSLPAPPPGGDALGVGDFDGDGIDDVAVAGGNGASGQIVVVLGGRTPRLAAPSPTVAEEIGVILVTDLDGDKHLDLLAVTRPNGAIFPFIGDGRGGFLPRDSIAAQPGSATDEMIDAALGDFDADGIPDLAVLNRVSDGSAYIAFLRGLGGGDYGVPLQLGELSGDGLLTALHPLGLADLDGDGRADVIFCHGPAEIYFSR